MLDQTSLLFLTHPAYIEVNTSEKIIEFWAVFKYGKLFVNTKCSALFQTANQHTLPVVQFSQPETHKNTYGEVIFWRKLL